MNEELKLHIKRLRRRSALSLISMLSAIISIIFGILFLFVPSFLSIIFFALSATSVIYIIYAIRVAKQEAKENAYKPIVFYADNAFSFEIVITKFKKLTENKNQLSVSEDVKFFKLNKIFKLRAVVYKTECFRKREFDNAKNRINKKANKELNISQWVDRTKANKMMRFNIIYADALNDELYTLISQNAAHNLTRVEGVINIAIVGEKIMIPPLYGECYLSEIDRYMRVIKFINQVLLNE